MTAITSLLDNATEILADGSVLVRITTLSTSDTRVCPYFKEIGAAIGNNESDTDGVGIGVSGTTITLSVGDAGDIVTLQVEGRG